MKRAKKEFIFPAFLIERERIVFKTHPHWLYVLVPRIDSFFNWNFYFRILALLFPKRNFSLGNCFDDPFLCPFLFNARHFSQLALHQLLFDEFQTNRREGNYWEKDNVDLVG
jgi:hypothetical protein